ncbi:MAG: hypothetical protein AB1781_10970 [Pseudomonadota bacterium]
MDAQKRQDQATLLTAIGQGNQMQYNADVALANAETARREGQREQERMVEGSRQLQSTITAQAAKAGVNPNTGSAALVASAAHSNAWLDWMTALWNKETEAVASENKATDLRYQADYTVRSAEAATGLSAGSSFVSDLYAPLRSYKEPR